MLEEGQLQVRDLVMGPGTPYGIINDFDPWSRAVRADETGNRAWGDGVWSGAEWMDEAVIPIRIRVCDDTDPTPARWHELHAELAAAFAASPQDVELRWVTGGVEYMLRGRPRAVQPESTTTIPRGRTTTKCAFAALDPHIYSGDLHTTPELHLPSLMGGLVLPYSLPYSINATLTAGSAPLQNVGKHPASLLLRVDGPCDQPRMTVTAAGVATTIRYGAALLTGQWLEIDTARRTAYLNGTSSRRGQITDGWPMLPPGTAQLDFGSATYDAAARLTATWRDTW